MDRPSRLHLALLASIALLAAGVALLRSARSKSAQAPGVEKAELTPFERRVVMNARALGADPRAAAFRKELGAEPGLWEALTGEGLSSPAQLRRFKLIVAGHAGDPGFQSAVEAPAPADAAEPENCSAPAPAKAQAGSALKAPEPGCSAPAAAVELFPGQNPPKTTPPKNTPKDPFRD